MVVKLVFLSEKIELFFRTAQHRFLSAPRRGAFSPLLSVVLQYDYFRPLMRHTHGDAQL